MAKNPRPQLPNPHVLYLARSGGGKSQALKQTSAIPRPHSGARVLIWDPARDQHRGTTYFNEPKRFALALLEAEKSGKGYRLGYDGPRTVEIFEWWCRCVWAVLDGNRPTFVLVEELGGVCPHPGEATPAHRRILCEGRKFNLHYHATSQRPQEISKTAFENVATWWIGQQKGVNVKRFADQLDVPEEQVRNLQTLEFLVMDERAGPTPARRIRLKYVK